MISMTHDEIDNHLPPWAILVKKLSQEAKEEKEQQMKNELPEKI